MKNKNINKFIDIAYDAHKGERRYNGELYINHPMRVCESVKKYCRKNKIKGVFDYQIVALLHDVLENNSRYTCNCLINLQVPSHCITSIALLTKSHNQDYTNYISELLHDKIARVVKMCDIYDNLEGACHTKQILYVQSLYKIYKKEYS